MNAPPGLSVTVLGCSGTYAGAGGACSGYLLRTATTNLWMDCGAGSLANIQRHVALLELDGIVVSHSHPDHWLELPVLLNALRYGVGAPDLGMPLLWTARTAEQFAAIAAEPEPTFAPQVIDERSTATIGDIDLSFSRTDHPVETLAIRAEHAGHSIVYSADTGDAWRLASLGPDIGRTIDLAIVEATLDEDDADVVQHLTASQAGRQAAEAGVATLVLTHLAPGSDPEARRTDAARAFAGPIEVADIDATFRA
ncbi:MBL fold metallo-hydrolase [Acidimicrobiia bacterium EGI L10123]|uniref:MBL fold metallo-hydrolase n=1 Tax=Salinilacustrithrix flava TaxID=2957203 RepID=UPI003D7C1798|nr:MBL fold metallo-hydrolase [Acidimicrobiia bacterium EGI L10123]